MEAIGDSYNEFMHRLQRVAQASSPANQNDIFGYSSTSCSPQSSPLRLHSQPRPISVAHSTPPHGLLPSSSPPCSAPALSYFSPPPHLSQQPRSLLQSNNHQLCCTSTPPISSHSRSTSQPSSFFSETVPQRCPNPSSSPFVHNGTHSHFFIEASPLQSPISLKQESASSDPNCRTSLTVDVLMNNQGTSPGPRGPVLSLPPLSPSISSHQSLSKRRNSDMKQFINHPTTRKGHRRAHSEIPFKFSTGAGCLFDNSTRQLSADLLGENIMSEVEGKRAGDTMWTNTAGRNPVPENGQETRMSKKELDWVHNTFGETHTHVSSEKERRADQVFSMFVGMETRNFESFGVSRSERTRNIDETEKLWNVNEIGTDGQRGIAGSASGMIIGDMEVETGRDSLLSNRIDENGDATDSAEGSDADESEREGSRVDGLGSLITENTEKDTGSSGAQFIRNGKLMETTMDIERSPACSVSHHVRSSSMDSMTHSLRMLDEVYRESPPEAWKARNVHNLKVDLANGEFDGMELKKIMADEKLQEVALVDPKRAKRILANRLSAARSKERKMRYISELERKVQTLQTEATSLSTQLALLQRDSTGLSNENSELKLRLQAMEQQAHLHEALNEALRDEVQRLKLAVAQTAGQASRKQHPFPAAHPGLHGPVQHVQGQQTRSSGVLSSPHQNVQSGFFKNNLCATFPDLTTST